MEKIIFGQYFTEKNIFKLKAFEKWFESIPLMKRQKILEPFAGSNNIIRLLKECDLSFQAISYDISPPTEFIKKRDTINNFPVEDHCDVIITNPPYLARNSATRKNFCELDFRGHADLYELALEVCLQNCSYVAAIIPATFVNSSKFKDRLETVIVLNYNDIFKDTETPVCLALFSPQRKKQENFLIYYNDFFIGNFLDYKKIESELFNTSKMSLPHKKIKVQFNNNNGSICLLAVDNNREESIYFTHTKNLKYDLINKPTSRAKSRIVIDFTKIPHIIEFDEQELIDEANLLIQEYRNKTHDLLLSPFKGIRRDGKYRRRLDFKCAKKIIIKAIHNLEQKEKLKLIELELNS
jgi:hypothetical protein